MIIRLNSAIIGSLKVTHLNPNLTVPFGQLNLLSTLFLNMAFIGESLGVLVSGSTDGLLKHLVWYDRKLSSEGTMIADEHEGEKTESTTESRKIECCAVVESLTQQTST